MKPDKNCTVKCLRTACGHDHTMRHLRETSTPSLFDRRVRQEWLADGGTDIYQRATAEAVRVLEQHEVEPLPDDVRDEIHRIVNKFSNEYAETA